MFLFFLNQKRTSFTSQNLEPEQFPHPGAMEICAHSISFISNNFKEQISSPTPRNLACPPRWQFFIPAALTRRDRTGSNWYAAGFGQFIFAIRHPAGFLLANKNPPNRLYRAKQKPIHCFSLLLLLLLSRPIPYEIIFRKIDYHAPRPRDIRHRHSRTYDLGTRI